MNQNNTNVYKQVIDLLDLHEKMLIESTGSGWYTDRNGDAKNEKRIRDASLVLLTIKLTGSTKDKTLQEITGLNSYKIRKIKSNMLKNRLLISHRGCRRPTIVFQDWDEDMGFEKSISFLMDVMVSAGELTRA